MNNIVIPYIPRTHFQAFHASKKRHRLLVVHRRGGKTVSIANELIKSALTIQRGYPTGRVGYIGPSFAQAKDTIWAYLKHYSHNIPGLVTREDDLYVDYPNKARIALYPGASAYERMRGLYFDTVAMDEFALLNPDAWGSVVRPCLADYRGRAIIAGTSNGDDHFHEMYQKALLDEDNWDVFNIKISDTGGEAIDLDEVEDMKRDMDDDKFNREMMNDFSSPIQGAYYANLINEARDDERVGDFPHDPRFPVVTSWDLGFRDLNAVWFWQRVQGRIKVIDYMQASGKGLDWWVQEIDKKPYKYSDQVFPHDIKTTEQSTGRTRFDFVTSLGVDVYICPSVPVLDRINSVRSIVPQCFFNESKVALGLSALRAYQSGNNGKPRHNWASHGADAFGHGSLCIDLVRGWGGGFSKSTGPIKRRIGGIV